MVGRMERPCKLDARKDEAMTHELTDAQVEALAYERIPTARLALLHTRKQAMERTMEILKLKYGSQEAEQISKTHDEARRQWMNERGLK